MSIFRDAHDSISVLGEEKHAREMLARETRYHRIVIARSQRRRSNPESLDRRAAYSGSR
ncbi:MAG: hypothetical protein O3C58_01395 [Nitrospinae bacterium]|nr:hypothetical protein [Nitrospinota bacterium]